jgi:hypothetical protein
MKEEIVDPQITEMVVVKTRMRIQAAESLVTAQGILN